MAKTQVAKAVAKTINGKQSDTALDIPEALKLFGKDKYLAACAEASEALKSVGDVDGEIRSFEAQILLKREGNAAKLKRLAVRCVELTQKGKRAMLENAAILFRDACSEAEESFMAAFIKAHPEANEAKIRDVVPSWPVLRGNTYNAMLKAHLDPRKFEKPSGLTQAYAEWKANPNNAGEKDKRGRKEGTDKTGSKKESNKAAELLQSMIPEVKDAMRTLGGTIAGLNKSQQKRAATALAKLNTEILGWITKDDTDKTVTATQKRPPNPARESAGTGATAE